MVLALIVSSVALLGLVAASGSSSPGSGPAPLAAAAKHDMYVGTVDLTLQTINPLQYTLVDEYYVLGNVYSFLINYDDNWNEEPDLAVAWQQTVSNPSTWVFHLTHNAFFVDPRGCNADGSGRLTSCGNNGFPLVNVKASDVKFTYDFVKANRYQTSYYVTLVESIASVDVIDDYTVQITFTGAYAPAMSTFTAVPILPEYIWSPGGVDVKVDWTNALPIGSGPYMVRAAGTSFAMVTPPPLIFDRNPVWHGAEVQGRQVFTDTIYFESYTTSAAEAVDLTLGKIDMALGPSPQDYTTFLAGKPGILRQAFYDGFEAEQAINVLPDELRTYFTATTTRPLNLGKTNPVLLDQTVRTAIHMATDRSKMISNALVGLGVPGDTLMPLSVPAHYSMPAYSTDDKNGDGKPYDFPPFAPIALEQFPDGPSALPIARQMLVDAGWQYVCSTGAPQTGTEFPLCKKDGSGKMVDALIFRYSTYNTEPWWETAARGVIEDAAKVGIQFNLELLNGSQMYNLWYRLDYDVWLWDWVWTPITDISTFMVVQTCKGIATLDNDNGFCLRDPITGHWTFDEKYNQTLVETDPVARRALSDQMNAIIYGYASYNLPFYRAELYAMNEVRWTNWGDFNAHRAVPPDSGNTPILGQWVQPVSSKPPQVSLPNFEGVVGQAVQFSAAASDPQGNPLVYRWDFDTSSELGGAGVNADSIPYNDDYGFNTATPTFTYGAPGTYSISLRVTENGGNGFFTVRKATVTIYSATPGQPPKINGITYGPSDPTTYAGDLVTLAASVVDPTGGGINQYTWNWGDGTAPTVTTLPTASHQYTSTGAPTVQLTARSTTGLTSSGTQVVPVVANLAPVLSPLQPEAVTVSTSATFVAFATDPNSRDTLTYSWIFGDGATGSGNPVSHTYTATGTPTLSVTVSDGHGHSATSSATVTVAVAHCTAPAISSLTATPSTIYQTQTTSVQASVSQDQGYPMFWEWDFNADGVIDLSYSTAATTPGAVVTRAETWQFSAQGSYKAKLSVTATCGPGHTANNWQTVTINVNPNAAPTLTDIAASALTVSPGDAITFSSTASDADLDQLSFVWQWGDGATTSGTTSYGGGLISNTHAYAFDGSYVAILIVNDGKGGETRKSVVITVIPKMTMTLAVTSIRKEMMSAEIATIRVTLMNIDGVTPVSAATLTKSSPLGGVFSSVRNLGSGVYEFDWTPNTVARQTYAPINVLAKAPTYYDVTGRIVILIDPNMTNPSNPTQLFLLIRAPATSMRAGQAMTVTLYLYTIQGYVVSGATVALLRSGPGAVSPAVNQLNGVYTFVYTAPLSVVSPVNVLISISASKYGYANASARLTITVTP